MKYEYFDILESVCGAGPATGAVALLGGGDKVRARRLDVCSPAAGLGESQPQRTEAVVFPGAGLAVHARR